MSITAEQLRARQLLLALVNDPVDTTNIVELIDPGVSWDELHRQTLRHGVLPLIYQGLRLVSESVPPEVLSRFQKLHATNTLCCLQMKKELQRILALFNTDDIPVIPYKGPTLAERAYGDLALRTFSDLDLLVPADQARRAVRLLEDDGYQLEFDLAEARWSSLLKTVNHLLLRHADSGFLVEVHWQVFHQMYLLPIDLQDYWEALKASKGSRVGVLHDEDLLLILCAHGTKHHWDVLKWIIDVQRLVSHTQNLDWDRLWLSACESGSCRSLLLGLALAGRVGGCELPKFMRNKLESDRVALQLADDVWQSLFREDPLRRRFVWECRYYLRSRERLTDSLQQVGRWLFYPRLEDWRVLPAGDRWFALFYLQRPVRMVWKWILSPFLQRKKSSSH